jgi:hypothetical protein
MKKLANIALTALIATTAIVGTARGAQAGCYVPLAANDIAMMLRGGATVDQAIQFAVNNGNLDSEACGIATLGYMRGYRSVYGDVLN